jgi:hypothetical protein
VVLSQSTDAEKAMPLPPAGSDSGLVSEELLHRAIRSNVDLAETLGSLVREMNLGLSSILSHAELAASYGDEGRRAAAVGNLQQEAARLRQLLNDLGRAGAASARPTPVAPTRPSTGKASPLPPPSPPLAPPAPIGPVTPRAAAPPQAPPTVAATATSLDALMREAAEAAHSELQVNAVAVGLKIAPGTALPRCPPASLRRAAVALFSGLAAASLYGTTIAVRSERKPVLLRTREGEVKRDFLMLAASHAATLGPDAQQRVLQGADPGPLGEAHRLVREMGGFLRFAPLPGGALETRVFLPAA